MAVVITKDLLAINPAYNDSIIQYASDTLTGNTRSEIVVNGITFNVVPLNGTFTFNFKEIVKSIINTNHFEDTVIPNLTAGYLYSDSNIRKSINVTIRIIGSSTEVLNKSYVFLRGVEQLPDYHRMSQIAPTTRVLLPTNNYTDYYCKFTEGYPFDIAIQFPSFSTYYFKNVTTGFQTSTYNNLTTSTRRIFFSDGANTTTETEALVMSSTLNKLELWTNSTLGTPTFRANIYVMKEDSDCGVYLKWLNRFGSYSYWKFDSVYKSTITSKTIDDFAGKYDNLQNVTSTSYLIGKTAINTLQVSTTYTAQDALYLQDLNTSPAVWMYTSKEPFHQIQEGDFFGVKVNDFSFENINTKSNKGKCSVTITMPNYFTQTQ